MAKIIIGSIAFILVVLGVNYLLSSGYVKLDDLSMDPPKTQELIANFRSTQESFPQRVKDGAGNLVKNAKQGIAGFFLKKTGNEVVVILKNLPAEQQKDIKKDYCGK